MSTNYDNFSNGVTTIHNEQGLQEIIANLRDGEAHDVKYKRVDRLFEADGDGVKIDAYPVMARAALKSDGDEYFILIEWWVVAQDYAGVWAAADQAVAEDAVDAPLDIYGTEHGYKDFKVKGEE